MGNCLGRPQTVKKDRRLSLEGTPVVATQIDLNPSDEGRTETNERRSSFSEEAEQNWKVFYELDSKDEADMMALASFFQTLAASSIIKQVDMSKEIESSAAVAIEHIKIDKVGRVDSVLHNLHEYNIQPQVKVTMEVALDVIDCFRRGGKLARQTVHKILKDVYWMLKKFPNIRDVNMSGRHQRVTVVGDLHGQFIDLLYILDDTGLPSPTNAYVFNGDFIDRGPCSLQVILTLFVLMLAEPTAIFLNRGNHEDSGICCVFGFMKECLSNYDEITFSMFVEVFRYLPLATKINDQVLVLHGGLFSQAGVLLQHIMEADRKAYSLSSSEDDADRRKSPKAAHSGGPRSPRRKLSEASYRAQIIKDILWSDPFPGQGRRVNPRGEGVQFGADVVEEFLKANRLDMIVRSHEVAPFGFVQPYQGNKKELLCTIFSASNYSSSGNHGAFLRFSPSHSKGCREVKPLSTAADSSAKPLKLYYTVHSYFNGDPKEQERLLRDATQASLANLIMKKKVSLRKAFEDYDKEQQGVVPIGVWCEILTKVTRLQVQWLVLLPFFMPSATSAVVAGDPLKQADDVIRYHTFLDSFHLNIAAGNKACNQTLFDALYVNRRELEAMFAFFDKDKNGSISRDEFRHGCETLNQVLPADEKLRGIDHLLDVIDFDHSNSIELNEFFEAFRLIDLQDGKLDGNIDIQIVSQKKHSFKPTSAPAASDQLRGHYQYDEEEDDA